MPQTTSKAALDNQINHVFGKSGHNLEVLLTKFGGNQLKAYQALEVAAQDYATANSLASFTRGTVVSVEGLEVTVRGVVVNGQARVTRRSYHDGKRQTMDHVEFEKGLMDKLLTGDDPVLEGLRNQYRNAVVKSRRFTGVGFYADFEVKNGIPPVAGGKSFQIGDIRLTYEGTKDAIGAILFVKSGYLSFLEGYTIGIDVWPDDYSNVTFAFDRPDGERDWEALKASWK